MRIALPRVVAASIATLVLTGCDTPTDTGSGTFVTVVADRPLALRGQQVSLHARVWRRTGADSVELPNVEFDWTSTNTHLATIQTTSHGVARLTGINAGVDTVRVIATGLQSARAARLPYRISNALAIDSIRPRKVRYGEYVTLYGVGVRDVPDLLFAGGFIAADTLRDLGDTNGVGQRSYWTTYPVGSSRPLMLTTTGLIVAPDSVTVVERDVYDPNSSAPAVIDLGATPEYAAPLHFYNPALAFEPLRDTTQTFGVDWFRFQVPDPSKPYTFVVATTGLAGTDAIYVADKPTSAGAPATWAFGQAINEGIGDCHGYMFRPIVFPVDSLVLPVTHLHAASVDLIAAWTQAGRYTMSVTDGYVHTGAIAPDRFESSSDCVYADENDAKPTTHIDLSAPFADTLTIDHPAEMDWLRIHVPGAGAQPISIATAPRPLAGVADSSDIDLYLLTVPSSGTRLSVVAADTNAGSNSAVTAAVAPGDYYIVIVDRVGVPTRYGLCAAIGAITCAPPAAPSRVVSVPRRRRLRR